MEITKDLKFITNLHTKTYVVLQIKLIKLEEYKWEIEKRLFTFYFVRYNSIIRPLQGFLTQTFRFFEKDLAEGSEDVAYLQDNVDSHLD